MSEQSSTAKKTWSLIGRLKVAGSGVRSALRRNNLVKVSPEFFQIATKMLDDEGATDGAVRDDLERKWQVIVSALARGVWDEKNSIFTQDRRFSFGVALYNANVSEMRVQRLIQGHGDALHDALKACIHQLIAVAKPFDPTQMADLVLSDGAPHEVSVRRRLARDYYRAADSAQSSSTTTKEAT